MENSKKQSAVELYSKKIMEILGDSVNNFTKEQTLANHYALKQAKEMEKEQIIEAHAVGRIKECSGINTDGEQYYNETYI